MNSNEDFKIEKIDNQLDGKNIAILISSGIAAYKTPSIIRHFRQHGANIKVFITPEASKFVTETTLEWASNNSIITFLSPKSEHLTENINAYVFVPITHNTISKIANGIGDNAVTTTFISALGKLENEETKILIAPTMHGSMMNSIYKENIEKLKQKGIKIIEPIIKLNKANIPKSNTIVTETIKEISKSSLKGKKVLITAGPTPGKIDNVRMIVNRFKGRLGIEIAKEAYMRGADVILIIGSSGLPIPSYIKTYKIRSYEEYYKKTFEILKKENPEFGIFSAAVADYLPVKIKKGKIPSGGAIKSISLKESRKVIKDIRKQFPFLHMTTFKYEELLTKEKLIETAKKRIDSGYNLVIANRGEDMIKEYKGFIVNPKKEIKEVNSKKDLSKKLMNILEKI